MQDKYKTAEMFIDENLEHHFKNEAYSIIGTKCCYDSMGGRYTSYVFNTYDVPNMTTDKNMVGWFVVLKDIIKRVNEIIEGLILAKQAEKPEGQGIEIRGVVVDWRSYPAVDISHGEIKVSLRVSLHHK